MKSRWISIHSIAQLTRETALHSNWFWKRPNKHSLRHSLQKTLRLLHIIARLPPATQMPVPSSAWPTTLGYGRFTAELVIGSRKYNNSAFAIHAQAEFLFQKLFAFLLPFPARFGIIDSFHPRPLPQLRRGAEAPPPTVHMVTAWCGYRTPRLRKEERSRPFPTQNIDNFPFNVSLRSRKARTSTRAPAKNIVSFARRRSRQMIIRPALLDITIFRLWQNILFARDEHHAPSDTHHIPANGRNAS